MKRKQRSKRATKEKHPHSTHLMKVPGKAVRKKGYSGGSGVMLGGRVNKTPKSVKVRVH